MDDRAYLPYLPDDPALAYATTSSGYLGHRLTGALRDSAANNILLQWPIDVDALGLERRRCAVRAVPAEAGAARSSFSSPAR